MKYALVTSVLLGVILLFLLAAASGNTALFSHHYALLLGLNAALALAVLGLVGYQLWVLTSKLRARVFGSRLTLRFLLMFLPMVIVPGGLVYVVSLQFMAKSIESWFDVRVDNALEGGLNLGRTALDLLLTELNDKARRMALELSDKTPAQQVVLLDRLREQAGVDDALLLSSGGNVIASARKGVGKLLPALPSSMIQRQARQSRSYAALEGAPDKGLSLRVLVPVAALSITEDERLLQLLQRVPPTLTRDAEAVQEVYRDYKELSLSRQGLKEIYILTLTLTLLLTLFSATALAFLLSARLSEPLALLAAGTQAVARGDYSRRAQVTSSDELGILTQSFNSMTEQLDDARSAAESHRAELETAKAYLENILANLSAGVLVLDEQLRLVTVNHGAGAILQETFDGLKGCVLADWPRLQSLARAIVEGFKRHDTATWQQQLELAERMLLVRGSVLPRASGGGYVVVFDDVTTLVQAQRATAWGEVARRLAHEIKNPLTPIQLSAERLQAKLASKLAPEDAAALKRATETIINQVAAMKGMVDDFGEYARTPAPSLQPLDLNALVREVLDLYEHAGAPLRPALQAGLPQVVGDPTQLRQVMHNLLQNAQDALVGRADPQIEVETERAGNQACLRISDNGCGFPEAIMVRVFEPYVTTKPKGTGLGLAIVKKIIDEHNGAIRVENLPEHGARVSILLPLLPESGRTS
ncbi:MAG: PAS domain-containing sensor histidine kinase [Betaproteobacteria bacterium RIFCSPLOWO2_12_FULL_64_23]|nr:MAG: PAS domain-containing sensor histidine kinase [Betaproteobacteria bacterium RIFCSPLOWO2_12_FULL_64_23]